MISDQWSVFSNQRSVFSNQCSVGEVSVVFSKKNTLKKQVYEWYYPSLWEQLVFLDARQMRFDTKDTRSVNTIFWVFKNTLSSQVAILIVIIWAISLWKCSQIQILNLNPLVVICSIGWQTWLDTGLFITAHDAMHGSITAINGTG